jgi:hypothetical protein
VAYFNRAGEQETGEQESAEKTCDIERRCRKPTPLPCGHLITCSPDQIHL